MPDSRRRVAVFVPSMRGGGAQRAMLSLACGLAARDDLEVDLVLAKKVGPYLSEIPGSVNVVDLKASRSVSAIPALIQYLRSERPVGMVSTQDYGNIIALCSRRLSRVRTRLVVSEQTTPSRFEYAHASWRRKLMVPLVKRCYPWADVISAVSDGVADDVAQFAGIPRDRIQTIYNPVIRQELNDLSRQELDDPWFQPDSPPVILAVGRLVAAKDYFTLIRAFAKVRQSTDARLMILGEGDERNDLEVLIDALDLHDCVRLPGFVANPYAYMGRAALFVLSSVREGLPTVLIEAMYCGLPVVSTDCPNGPREILCDGKYGRLVPMENVDALATAIVESLGTEPAPAESCRPYEQDSVVDRYLQALVES